jgi:hypothetical protein
MATHKTFDVVATVGEYPDHENPGETKKRYKNCGAVFVRDDGSQFMKLDTIPVGEWNGWLAFYPPRNRQAGEQQQQQQQPERPRAPAPTPTVDDDDFDDDIPF